MSRTRLIAIVLAVLVIGVGIGSCAKDQPTAADVTPTPTVTPAPNLTTEPTPTETLAPTDTPEVVAYMAYLDWAGEWAAGNTERLNRLAQALEDTDPIHAAGIARDLRTRYRDGITWLEANPPAACYAEVHTLMLGATRDFEKSSTAQIRWLDDFPFGSQADFDTFTKYVNSGTATLNKANDIDPDC